MSASVKRGVTSNLLSIGSVTGRTAPANN